MSARVPRLGSIIVSARENEFRSPHSGQGSSSWASSPEGSAMSMNTEGSRPTVVATRTPATATGPRRVVDLVTDKQAGALAAPSATMTYHQGKVLTAVEVFTVFWGTTWGKSPQNQIVGEINGFFDAILTSSLMDVLAEYSVPGQTIGHGSRIGSATVTNSEPGQASPG